jgi:hypothetical protein
MVHFVRKTVNFWTDLLVCDLSGTCKVSARAKFFFCWIAENFLGISVAKHSFRYITYARI